MRRFRAVLPATAAALLGAAGCGGEDRPSYVSTAPGWGGRGDAGTALDGGGIRLPDAAGVVLPDGSVCGAEERRGEALPLDLIVMLDRSESMLELTSAGVSKWEAVGDALASFVADPALAGVGVGLQFFPLQKSGVPESCASHDECGPGGPCFLSACQNETTLVACVTDADCRPGPPGTCAPFGICDQIPAGGSVLYCAPMGLPCAPGYGDCLDFGPRWCTNATSCESAAYATLAVPVEPLGTGRPQVIGAVRGTRPSGRTPTGPALAGALDAARARIAANPGRRVAVVLATDGLPTECAPTAIGAVGAPAAAAFSERASISTFVIGVFGPGDLESPRNLDQLAAQGGTTRAFLVDTSGDVAAEFRAALDEIRGAALLACDLELPPPPASGGLDYFRVNLRLTEVGGSERQLAYVESSTGCGAAPGAGWYYDVDPRAGGTPTRITVCPDVCDAFRAGPGARVTLQIGCETIIR